MNAVLVEIYSTILPAAPYVIGAYALIWLALFVYVFFIMRRVNRAEKQMAILEEAFAEKVEQR
ncbi:MAG: CcmD family protein [Raoultibacter sp.]